MTFSALGEKNISHFRIGRQREKISREEGESGRDDCSPLCRVNRTATVDILFFLKRLNKLPYCQKGATRCVIFAGDARNTRERMRGRRERTRNEYVGRRFHPRNSRLFRECTLKYVMPLRKGVKYTAEGARAEYIKSWALTSLPASSCN